MNVTFVRKCFFRRSDLLQHVKAVLTRLNHLLVMNVTTHLLKTTVSNDTMSNRCNIKTENFRYVNINIYT